jgi:hypothetical protein
MNDKSIIVDDELVSSDEVSFEKRLADTKMTMLTERLNRANDMLGLSNRKSGVTARNGSTDDMVPFTAIKKYAKMFKGTKDNHLWEVHTDNFWNKQMQEVEGLAVTQVAEEMAKESQKSEIVVN